MERLTEYVPFAYKPKDGVPVGEIVQRLAEYEDLDLGPEQLSDLISEFNHMFPYWTPERSKEIHKMLEDMAYREAKNNG